MRSPLSQAQLGVYYACEASVDDARNYQNPVLLPLPGDTDTERVQQAVYDALCAHPYILGHIEPDGENLTPVLSYGEGKTPVVEVKTVSEAEWEEVC